MPEPLLHPQGIVVFFNPTKNVNFTSSQSEVSEGVPFLEPTESYDPPEVRPGIPRNSARQILQKDAQTPTQCNRSL